jgi:phosphatidate cytidylyltransferase
MTIKRSFILRLLTTLVLVPLTLLLIWAPRLDLFFSLFIAMLACIGALEYFAMLKAKQIPAETIPGVVAATVVAASGHFASPGLTAMLMYGSILTIAAVHVVRCRLSLEGLAASVFGAVYVGWFAAHMILLHKLPKVGAGLVTVLLVAVAVTDAFAYLGGSALGRHKLIPHVSPAKTWEGAAVGFFLTLCGMAIVYAIGLRTGGWPDWTLARYVCVGALLSVVAQIGDLAESSMKRSAGVKDSGEFFPGHGGVLDRCDGFLFAAPALYYVAANLF